VAKVEKAIAVSGGSPFVKGNRGWTYAKCDREKDALIMISELKDIPKKFQMSLFIASVYAGLGEKNEALGWIEKAYEQRLPLVTRCSSFGPISLLSVKSHASGR